MVFGKSKNIGKGINKMLTSQVQIPHYSMRLVPLAVRSIKGGENMPRNFVHKTFAHWLKKNKSRFQKPPKIIKYTKNGLKFGFHGITQHLQGYIDTKWGFFTISVTFNKICWDIIAHFDIECSCSLDGKYYCISCNEAYEDGLYNEKPAIYTSRYELWEHHTFDPFLKWVNQNLKSSNRLCLNHTGDEGDLGSTWARILPVEKTNTDQKAEDWKFILPVVSGK